MFLTFLLRLITRLSSKCYGLINLIHVLSFSDISFKYCTLYCHFSLIFVTLHVRVFLFYKKKNAMVYIVIKFHKDKYVWMAFFFKMGLKRFSFRDKHGVKLIDVIFLEINSTFNVYIMVNIHVILALAFLSSAALLFLRKKVIYSRCHNSDLNYCI